MSQHEDRLERTNAILRRAFGADPVTATRRVIQEITGDTVKDIQEHAGGDIEVWMGPNGGLTENELNTLQEVYRFREIGVYGDAQLPDGELEGSFHFIVVPRDS